MPATALEQMILELVNRARLDPAAEAARYGIALNEGVPAADTISTVSKQPLAMNETLLGTARAHSQDMIDRDYFAHDTPEGVTPFQRMANAGYNYTTAGENIALVTSSSASQTRIDDLHQFLFVDLALPAPDIGSIFCWRLPGNGRRAGEPAIMRLPNGSATH